MQVCALDDKNCLVFAEKAAKQKDYGCLECGEIVRLRSGVHRKAHFYHSKPNGKCRLHSKGMPHLMLQYRLHSLLPNGEGELECRFPSIGRIADVVWHTKHIVYEIQCSPISAEEVLARNADYASVGYQVVWIFHASRYNQYRLSAAEKALSDSPHYFTTINSRGDGEVYDQYSIVDKGMRKYRLPPLPVDLVSPLLFPLSSENFPSQIRLRMDAWPIYFAGDTIDSCVKGVDKELLAHIERLPDTVNPLLVPYVIGGIKNIFDKWIAGPYQALFKLLLEKASG
ncbi:MAG: competence protein CoiA family protein [Parachlamydiaceae bacterium]